MEDLAKLAIGRALDLGVGYADVRIINRHLESLQVKNGKVEFFTDKEDKGFGIRVICEGAWGFASSSEVNKEEMERVVDLAVRIAKASGQLKGRAVELAPLNPVVASYKTKIRVEPFEVGLDEKIQLLLDCDRIMRQEPKIKVSEGFIEIFEEDKVFASSEGAFIDQRIVHTGGGIKATAMEAGEVQERSFPHSGGGNFGAGGYEFIEGLKLVDNAERIAKEAAQLLNAQPCPGMKTTIILDGSQLALQVHESCGHPIELDRVLGTEASYAGTSFLTPDKLNNFQYGSEIVNITADATIPGGLGTFGYDDEGVPGQRIPIVKNGLFVGYLTSRETAHQFNQLSNGAMRADGWNRIPLIRMTNINLEPGDWALDELIEDAKEGIYMETNKSWSIDDKRLNFQFGAEIAYEIKDGALGRILKNPTYTGITHQFWNSCDGIANENSWQLWGLLNCGKGEPLQLMRVGHGTSPARFRNVQVGLIPK